MSRNKIKGITLEIGGDTTGLNKALGDVNKSSRDIQKELREVDKLLRFNPGNVELIAQKKKLLGDQVETTREKLDKLREAEKQVQEQFERGEIREDQYRAFQREIVETESKLKHYENQLRSVTDTKRTLGDRLTEVSNKMSSVGKSMQNVGGTLSKSVTAPIMAATAGLVGLAVKAGQAADRILDLSQITGLSTDSIQEWQHVATIAGVGAESMTKAVEGLITRIPQLEKEGGKATEALDKLGLSFEELKVMTPDEQIDTLIKGLSDMENPMERNAAGAALFGGAWKDIAPILGMTADEIEAAKNEAHALGRVLSGDSLNNANDFRVAMDKLKETVKSAALQMGADLAPMLMETLVPAIEDHVIPAIQKLIEFVGSVIEWFTNLSPGAQKAVGAFVAVAAAVGPVLVILGKLAGAVSAIIGLFGAGGAAAGAGATLVGAFTVITGPIGIAIAAVAALIAIGVALYKNWDTIKAKAVQLWEFLKAKFEEIKEAITRPITNAMDIISSINLYEIGKNIIQGLINGIKNMAGKVRDTVGEVANTVKNGITGALGIRSPSRVMMGYGEDTAQGFVLGIEKSLKAVSSQMGALAGAAIGGVGSAGMAAAVGSAGQSVAYNSPITVQNMYVRDERDVERVARELYSLQRRRSRGV